MNMIWLMLEFLFPATVHTDMRLRGIEVIPPDSKVNAKTRRRGKPRPKTPEMTTIYE